jgi:hypothetical protein
MMGIPSVFLVRATDRARYRKMPRDLRILLEDHSYLRENTHLYRVES